MKILSIQQIRDADAYTIAHEPVLSDALMERAAKACFSWILNHTGRSKSYKIFCGTGNNGGDGLVIARLMAGKNINNQVFIINTGAKKSGDFSLNYQRLSTLKKVSINEINDISKLPKILPDDIVIDAIFGSGLTRSVEGIAAEVIVLINKSGARIISVDIPSGLYGEDNSGNKGSIIKAHHTLTFQFPKLSFFYPENGSYTGKWEVLPIGLHQDFISKAEVKNYFVEHQECSLMLKVRNRFAHKGHFGHALLVCGSYGMAGAAVLAARACLKSGAGLVTAHIPEKNYSVMQAAAPEIMASVDEHAEYFTHPPELKNYNAVCTGCGLGTSEATAQGLKMLIQNFRLPMVVDADALNILSENKTWLAFLPANSILTPHPGEFERLAGKSDNAYERQQKQIELSVKFNLIIVLKGAYTCISMPSGNSYFNSTGNPGMATAGSGDVLSGIITALLAQNYQPAEAAILGVYLHGLAGNLAAARYGYESMTAGDIISMLGKAFKRLY